MKKIKSLRSCYEVLFSNKHSGLVFSILIFVISTFLIIYSDWDRFKQNPASYLQKNIAPEIGYSMLAALIAFVAFELGYKRLESFQEKAGYKTKFSKEEFCKKTKRTTSGTVRILETWTSLLLESEEDDHEQYDFYNIVKNSIRNTNTEFQFLLLNPENFFFVNDRKKQLKNIDVESNIYINCQKLTEIKDFINKNFSNKHKNIEVRLYNTNPFLAIYGSPSDLFLAFFRKDQQTTESQYLRVTNNSPLGEFLNERFDQIFKDNKITKTLEEIWYLNVQVSEIGLLKVEYIKYQPQVKRNDEWYWIRHEKVSLKENELKDNFCVTMEDKEWSVVRRDIDPQVSEEVKSRVKFLFDSKYSGKKNLAIFRLVERQ